MTEDERRHRGNAILRAILEDIRGDTHWVRIRHNPAGVEPPTDGLYDPISKLWDTKAGRRGGPPAPEATIIDVEPDPRWGYPGERIVATRQRYLQTYTNLSRARVLASVRQWANVESTAAIAAWQRSKGRVAWTHDQPEDLKRDLQRAVLIASDAMPRRISLDTPQTACT